MKDQLTEIGVTLTGVALTLIAYFYPADHDGAELLKSGGPLLLGAGLGMIQKSEAKQNESK